MNRRHVHFPALNWEEEQKRANRGVALRRELRREQRQRKHRQKQYEQQRESDRRKAFLVLRNPDNADRILRLCDEDEALASFINLFLRRMVGENPRPQQLEEFRSHNDHLGMDDGDLYDWMKNISEYAVSMDFLAVISGHSHFGAVFLSDGVVVSDDSIITRSSSNASDTSTVGPEDPKVFSNIKGRQGGDVEEPPVPEAEVPGNDDVNQPEHGSAPKNAAYAAADDGGVQELSVPEAEIPGNDDVNQPENEPAPENAAYAAAGADHDTSRGSNRALSPQANWTDHAKKQRTDS